MTKLSHVMTAKQLDVINPNFEIGIVYHLTEDTKVQQLLEIVDRYARPYGPNVMEKGTAFLRLNTNVKKNPNRDSWQMLGGALSQPSMTQEINDVVKLVETNNPDYVISDRLLTAWVINEWDRYSVVFELTLTVQEKQ